MTATGTFIFICPACGYKARLPEQYAGRTIKCPGCQAPQEAKAQANVERKTASIIRVAATPVPFTLPPEQSDALAGAPIPSGPAPMRFPSPLPGAIQITTDRISRMNTPMPSDQAPVAKAATTGTVDFTCHSCNARMRLPGHYAGKSILCPKCSTPQKVAQITLAEPMDTTRSLANKDEPAAIGSTSGTGSGTGRRVRVTPLPAAYPTPVPTAIPPVAIPPQTTPIPASASPNSEQPLEEKSPIATLAPINDGDLGQAIDEAAGAPVAPSKPHPSKGKLKTESITRAAPVAPSTKPASAPTGLIAAIGGLLIVAIALGAGLAYYALALGETRTRLSDAERTAKDSTEREQHAAQKLKDLETRLAELEASLKAAAAKAAEISVPAPEAKPEVKPDAEVKAPAPAPAPEVAPAPTPTP